MPDRPSNPAAGGLHDRPSKALPATRIMALPAFLRRRINESPMLLALDLWDVRQEHAAEVVRAERARIVEGLRAYSRGLADGDMAAAFRSAANGIESGHIGGGNDE